MGDGKNLKKYLDEKGTNVLQPYIQLFKKIPIFDLILH